MERDVRSVEDVLRLLDGMFEAGADRWSDRGGGWWDGFYADREREVPFFVAKPDENLATYLDRGLVAPGRALDLGSGPGRNAVFLAGRGFDVEAVDLSATAVAWGEERAREAGVAVAFHRGDAFDLVRAEPHAVRADAGLVRDESDPLRAGPRPPRGGPYDLVYDSGCFHHLPPHRRVSYLALLRAHVAPGGHFGLACFAAGGRRDGVGAARRRVVRGRAAARRAGVHGGVAAMDLRGAGVGGGRAAADAGRGGGVGVLRRGVPVDGPVPATGVR